MSSSRATTTNSAGRDAGIKGAANPVTWGFDAPGRMTSAANLLGTFTYGYDG